MERSAHPIIGITPSPATDTLEHGTFERYVMARTYVDAVRAAGGIPIILPPGETNIDALLELLDGVILSGGADVEPNLYGDDAVHPTTYGIDLERDTFELALVGAIRERDLPLLSICRGIQVLNVAFGGSLIQDIDDQTATPLSHRQQRTGLSRNDTSHDVTIAEGAHPLRQLVDAATLPVNSFHHQAIRDVGPGLDVIATAPDGVIEAVVCPAMRFGLGVQWHPEMLALTYQQHLAIFGGLVAAAAQTRSPLAR